MLQMTRSQIIKDKSRIDGNLEIISTEQPLSVDSCYQSSPDMKAQALSNILYSGRENVIRIWENKVSINRINLHLVLKQQLS